jgi:hypothetical protein
MFTAINNYNINNQRFVINNITLHPKVKQSKLNQILKGGEK